MAIAHHPWEKKMNEETLQELFGKLKKLLEKNSAGLEMRESVIGSQAKGSKPALHLYGKKPVAIPGRKPQQTYLAGIILQKNFVGLYMMPIYSHPQLTKNLSPQLRRMLKGKSCFNVNQADRAVLSEIDKLLKEGKAL